MWENWRPLLKLRFLNKYLCNHRLVANIKLFNMISCLFFFQDDEDQTASVEELEKQIEKVTKVNTSKLIKVLLFLFLLLGDSLI